MKRWLREKEKSTKCSVESPHSRSTKMLRGVKFNFQSKKKRNTVRRSFEFNFVLNRSVKAKVQERKPTAKTHIVKCSFVQHCSQIPLSEQSQNGDWHAKQKNSEEEIQYDSEVEQGVKRLL